MTVDQRAQARLDELVAALPVLPSIPGADVGVEFCLPSAVGVTIHHQRFDSGRLAAWERGGFPEADVRLIADADGVPWRASSVTPVEVRDSAVTALRPVVDVLDCVLPRCPGLDVTVGWRLRRGPTGDGALITTLSDGRFANGVWDDVATAAPADVWIDVAYYELNEYLLGWTSYKDLLSSASVAGDIVAMIAAAGVVEMPPWRQLVQQSPALRENLESAAHLGRITASDAFQDWAHTISSTWNNDHLEA